MAFDRAIPDEGLSCQEARRRLARDGPNILPVPEGPPVVRKLAEQVVHFFALMLWVAGILAFVAGLPELAVAIFVVIVVNGLFAFVQEYRAERAAASLRDLLPRRATVIRGGERIEIDASELVHGDVVSLDPGDRISADLRVSESHALRIDTSTMTGESVPSDVSEGETAFAGTFVTEGEGVGIVTATAGRTRLAGLARLVQTGERPRPPLAIELSRVVRTIALVALGVGVAFFVLSVVLGMPAADGFVFGIGVTVALVPEALLPTVTLSLAVGAQRMAQRHALVRRLESVETLGSTTFICTDKTGTLTRNEMSVVEAWTPAGLARVEGRGYEPVGVVRSTERTRSQIHELARVAARCSKGSVVERGGRWIAQGDPMEAALSVFATRVGVQIGRDRALAPYRRRFPFDPRRRRTSIVAGGRLLVMGAPDAVLPRCRTAADAHKAAEAMTARGLRVLAMASRKAPDVAVLSDAERAEVDLTVVGLIGIEDPPRPEVADAIAACRVAGVKVAMVTGDHPATAAAIAREVGLFTDGETVLVGADLPADEAELGELVDRDGIVMARIDPEDKLRVARALHARGHVLAMTGDGVNDGPALRAADIGVAMGRSGTDVAREASDLVLLDDDFATIVAAIEHGRAIYANVRRFLTYHLTDNVAEVTPFVVWALLGGRFPLALGVLQILALDIGTDTLSATALGAERPAGGVLTAPPARGRLLDRAVARRAFGLLGPVEALMTMAAFVVSLLASGWRPGEPFPRGAALAVASGAAFATVVIAQTANAFACRSTTRTPWRLGWSSNRLLVVGASIELAIASCFLFVPPIATALGHASPTAAGWTIAASAAGIVLVADALQKAIRRRSDRDRR